MGITDITTARILEDAIRHLADARLATDPLMRLAAVSLAQRELVEILSRVVNDVINDHATVDHDETDHGDVA